MTRRTRRSRLAEWADLVGATIPDADPARTEGGEKSETADRDEPR